MSGSLFDTLEAFDALTRAGPAQPQARAIAATMRKAVSDVAELRAELWAVKWVLGFVLAIVPAMAARLFGVVQGRGYASAPARFFRAPLRAAASRPTFRAGRRRGGARGGTEERTCT